MDNKTMKQLWYTKAIEVGQSGKYGMEMKEVPVPTPGPGQVLVKTAYAAVCASDIHMITMGILGAKPGIPLGHEASGTIVEMGTGCENSGLKVGDKVTFQPTMPCNDCAFCKAGMGQYCEHKKPIAAFGEYILSGLSAVYKLPDDADLKKYCLTEPNTCCIRAMDIAQIQSGQRVAIAGIGGIGAIMLNQIILTGATDITVIEPSTNKHAMAMEMGAAHCIDPFNEDVVAKAMEYTDGKGYDLVFECSGAPKSALTPLNILAKCGKAIYFAVYPPTFEMPLNLYELYRKEASIHTVFTSPFIVPRSINSVSRLQTDKIIGKVVPFDEWEDAIDAFDSKLYPKVIFKF